MAICHSSNRKYTDVSTVNLAVVSSITVEFQNWSSMKMMGMNVKSDEFLNVEE